MFYHKSYKRGGKCSFVPRACCLVGNILPSCATLRQWRTLLGRLGELFEEAQLGPEISSTLCANFCCSYATIIARQNSSNATKEPATARSAVTRFRTSRCHFRRSVRDRTYSRSQRSQNIFFTFLFSFRLISTLKC